MAIKDSATVGYPFIRTDVKPTDGQYVRWNNTSKLWEPVSEVKDHVNDATIHRSIDDASTTTTNLWSADKINTTITTAASTVADDLTTHIDDTTVHHVIDDASTSTTKLWSSQKTSDTFGLYYTKTELNSTGGAHDRVDWSQIKNTPSFGSAQWLASVEDITGRDAIVTTGLIGGECVLVRNDGDNKAAQYEWNGTAWVKIADVDWKPYTNTEILTLLKEVDGASSGLDADLLDGQEGTYYTNASNLNAGILPSARFDDTSHGDRSGGTLHAAVTTSVNGFMSAADKTKLDSIDANTKKITYLIQTANYSANANDFVFVNTTSSSFNITLPATPALGDTIYIADAAANLSTNPVTILRNGKVIMGISDDYILDVDNVSRKFIFVNDTLGWRVF